MAEEGQKDTGKEHNQYGFVIPAGVLIGPGVGLLVGYVGSGVLIGLGLGFLGSGLIPLIKKAGPQPGSSNVTLILLGAFLIFLGVGLVFAPAALWPYAIAGFFILIGIWFLVRGFYKLS